jgi:hypothetical protein
MKWLYFKNYYDGCQMMAIAHVTKKLDELKIKTIIPTDLKLINHKKCTFNYIIEINGFHGRPE